MTNEKLDKLVAGAVEAETVEGRHAKEEAILATLAKAGPDNPFRWTFSQAFTGGTLTFTRTDLAAIAEALWTSICLDGVAADMDIIKGKLKAADVRVEDAVLQGILAGAKGKDISIAEAYIGIMAKEDRWRGAEEVGRKYLAKVEKAKAEGGDVDTASAGLMKAVFDLIKSKKLVKEYQVEADGIPAFLTDMADRRADGRAFKGLDCGFNHLNHVLNGLTEGVFILAGMPSCGKTTLAKQIADHVAAVEKVPVLFWSFEQSQEELRIKSLARLASVDSRGIWKGRSDADTWAKVEKAAEEYRYGPGRCLTIIEAGREDTLDRIRGAAVMAKHKAGDKPILLVMDYLQIIPAGKDAPEDTRARIDWNLSELRRLSRDLKSPVLVISSMNRASYGDPSKPPTMTALKESGGIEYTADAVICLWRNEGEAEHLKQYENLTVRVEAHVLKNRNGETGSKIKLDFIPAWADFQTAKE